MKLTFTKMHGAGNDFVIVDQHETDTDWGKIAIAVCDRHHGIGGDGLLLFTNSNVADFGMRILNADGSEAITCGNGIRCLVKYYLDKNGIDASEGKVSLETLAGIRQAWFHRTGKNTAQIRVGMGRPAPEFKPITNNRDQLDIKSIKYSAVIHDEGIDLALVSIGNLHAVYFSNRPVAEFPLSQIGPLVEHYPAFNRGANFEVARILDQGQIEARVWENGVGETLACGSGACAIAVAAHTLGLADSKVQINLPGGALAIDWDGVSEVYLTGPAETLFHGEWTDFDPDRIELSHGPNKYEVLA